MKSKSIKFVDIFDEKILSIMAETTVDYINNNLFTVDMYVDLQGFSITCMTNSDDSKRIQEFISKIKDNKQEIKIEIHDPKSNRDYKKCIVERCDTQVFVDHEIVEIYFAFIQEQKKINRKSWDEYYMDMAFAVAEPSTCERLHVGAVIVKNNRVKATGFNGSPRGLEHCDESGCYMVDKHCVRTIHAELNALLNCSPEEREGATLYVTDRPCPECQKLIIDCGIKRVVYARYYEPNIDWLSKTDIIVDCFKKDQK